MSLEEILSRHRATEGREEDDVYPTCYRMNTRKAVRRLAESGGLDVAGLDMVNSSAETIMLGPLVVLELGIIRLLNSSFLAGCRSNIIGVLRKPADRS